MSFLRTFARIRVINLPERRDRRRAMRRELRKLGYANDPRVKFFSAIKPDDKGDFTSIGARGVYESQLTLLKEAAQAGDSILILEDDCTFRQDAGAYSSKSRWHLFYGGYYASDPDDLHSSDIIGAHMMGFSAVGARLVVQYLEKLGYEGIHPPIDAAYVWFRRAHPEIYTEFAIPPLAYQRRSRSDIADLKLYDRIPLVRNLINALRDWRPSNPL
jgi:GR25 family glycosyltransferase involved in LPS biosynthesis